MGLTTLLTITCDKFELAGAVVDVIICVLAKSDVAAVLRIFKMEEKLERVCIKFCFILKKSERYV